MGSLSLKNTTSYSVSVVGDGYDGIYILSGQSNSKRFYRGTGNVAILSIQWRTNNNRWAIVSVGGELVSSQGNTEFPWEANWNIPGQNIILTPINLNNNKVSIKKQNIFVSAPEESVNPSNGADPRGRFLLQNTLVNGNKWYLKSATQASPIHRIVRNFTTGQWFIQFLFNNWITSYTSIDSANNPWEATWNIVQVSLGSRGKITI